MPSPVGSSSSSMAIHKEARNDKTITESLFGVNNSSNRLGRSSSPEQVSLRGMQTAAAAYNDLEQNACKKILGDNAGIVLDGEPDKHKAQLKEYAVNLLVMQSSLTTDADKQKHSKICADLNRAVQDYGRHGRKGFSATYYAGHDGANKANVRINNDIDSLVRGCPDAFKTAAGMLQEQYLNHLFPQVLEQRTSLGLDAETANESSRYGNATSAANSHLLALFEKYRGEGGLSGLNDFIHAMVDQLDLGADSNAPAAEAPKEAGERSGPDDEALRKFLERGGIYQRGGDVRVDLNGLSGITDALNKALDILSLQSQLLSGGNRSPSATEGSSGGVSGGRRFDEPKARPDMSGREAEGPTGGTNSPIRSHVEADVQGEQIVADRVYAAETIEPDTPSPSSLRGEASRDTDSPQVDINTAEDVAEGGSGTGWREWASELHDFRLPRVNIAEPEVLGPTAEATRAVAGRGIDVVSEINGPKSAVAVPPFPVTGPLDAGQEIDGSSVASTDGNDSWIAGRDTAVPSEPKNKVMWGLGKQHDELSSLRESGRSSVSPSESASGTAPYETEALLSDTPMPSSLRGEVSRDADSSQVDVNTAKDVADSDAARRESVSELRNVRFPGVNTAEPEVLGPTAEATRAVAGRGINVVSEINGPKSDVAVPPFPVTGPLDAGQEIDGSSVASTDGNDSWIAGRDTAVPSEPKNKVMWGLGKQHDELSSLRESGRSSVSPSESASGTARHVVGEEHAPKFELNPGFMPLSAPWQFNGVHDHQEFFKQIASGIASSSGPAEELRSYIKEGKNPAQARPDSADPTEQRIHKLYAAAKEQSPLFGSRVERLFKQFSERNIFETGTRYADREKPETLSMSGESRVILSPGSTTALSGFAGRSDVG